uniref:CRAL-TRIO domain-containing protein n=1 Tax=Timema tahoe TaxID=61484 RepID=A0A7R9ITL7_9NEOP|nr:unnamed protein product [Timema tahoe]
MVLIPKLSKRIIVHTSGLGSLHDHIHPKYLPLEYGGELGPVQDIWGEFYVALCGIVVILGQRTLSPNVTGSWNKRTSAANEEKRPGKPLDQSELFGMEGSFKKLSVD